MDYKQWLRYDDGKLYWIAKTSPNANRIKIGSEAYRYDTKGYKRLTVNGKSTSCHRIIWEMHNGKIPKGLSIDHINRVPDDNRIENLRLVTKSQNALNSKLKETNTLGIKGVYKYGKGWVARFKGINLYKGDSFAEAYRARLKAIHSCTYSTSL